MYRSQSLLAREVSATTSETYDSVWMVQASRRGDTRGNLYNNNIPSICVTQPDEEWSRCLVDVSSLAEEMYGPDDVMVQFEPYFLYNDDDGKWIEVGLGEWSVLTAEEED